jgi:membrane protease YdiL (CAAX protease family)
MTFTWTAFFLTLLGAGILVPISEELYFRGLIHSWFWQKTQHFWVRVLASSAIFGLAHYDSIGVVAASFVIGVINAILFEKTQSLFAPIIVHMTTNSIATILLFFTLAMMEMFPQFFP